MFDSRTEALAAAGLRVAHPPAELRHRLDSKIVTTQLGNDAGVPSVPNVLGRAASYQELTALACEAGLGEDLVVQMPYGDSGKTTFFIKTQADWDACSDKEPLADHELKVMRRIDHRAIVPLPCSQLLRVAVTREMMVDTRRSSNVTWPTASRTPGSSTPFTNSMSCRA